MCSTCENCDLLVKLERERIKWAKDLSLKNIELHKKLAAQQDLITILKIKLSEKRIGTLSDYIKTISATTNDEEIIDENNYPNNYSTHAQVSFRRKIYELNSLLRVINNEREKFRKFIEENEKDIMENISYLRGEIEYFRESLFAEMEKANNLKQSYNKKISRIVDKSRNVVLNTLQDEVLRLDNELKSRYKRVILKSKEEIERQTRLVSKLRKHNMQLYLHMNKVKKENENVKKKHCSRLVDSQVPHLFKI